MYRSRDPSVVLASASPRRRELLAQIGVPCIVRVADLDESVRAGESPVDYVQRLARSKALAVAERHADGLPVLGADTTVALADGILGKPGDAEDAARMLRRLSGRAHRVLTAVALHAAGGTRLRLSETTVWFVPLDEARINRYVRTGEPLDKAGAYGIQGFGAAFVARIEGSYSGVVGLPLMETAALLEAAGVPYWKGSDD